jgi:hypothetical protein
MNEDSAVNKRSGAMRNRVYWLLLVLMAVAAVLAAPQPGSAQKNPRTYDRPEDKGDAWCGKPGLVSKSHWDDGKGNDLTVEEWCQEADTNYFTVKVMVSKEGKQTVVVQPGDGGNAIDPGPC